MPGPRAKRYVCTVPKSIARTWPLCCYFETEGWVQKKKHKKERIQVLLSSPRTRARLGVFAYLAFRAAQPGSLRIPEPITLSLWGILSSEETVCQGRQMTLLDTSPINLPLLIHSKQFSCSLGKQLRQGVEDPNIKV